MNYIFFIVIHCIHYTEAYLSQLCLMQYSALLNYHLTETITVYFWNGNPPFVCHFEWIISYVRKQWNYKVDRECIKWTHLFIFVKTKCNCFGNSYRYLWSSSKISFITDDFITIKLWVRYVPFYPLLQVFFRLNSWAGLKTPNPWFHVEF